MRNRGKRSEWLSERSLIPWLIDLLWCLKGKGWKLYRISRDYLLGPSCCKGQIRITSGALDFLVQWVCQGNGLHFSNWLAFLLVVDSQCTRHLIYQQGFWSNLKNHVKQKKYLVFNPASLDIMDLIMKILLDALRKKFSLLES